MITTGMFTFIYGMGTGGLYYLLNKNYFQKYPYLKYSFFVCALIIPTYTVFKYQKYKKKINDLF